MNYLILVASVVIQVCLGGVYAWSTFVPDLKAAYGLTTAQTQFIFGVQIAIFSITMVFSGRILERQGPRRLLTLSGGLFLAGYWLASASGGSFLLLLLGIGGMAGVAAGFGYVCPLSTCMKWFPSHKGLVTGIAVAGFGGGAIVLASLAEILLKQGTGSLAIFRYVGLAYGIAIVGAGSLMKFPPCAPSVSPAATVPSAQLARDAFFWALLVGMGCGTFAGLLTIGNLKPIALSSGLSPSLAAMGISVFAAGNAAGRITWGRLVDKMSSKSIRPSLGLLAVALAVLLPAASQASLFILVASLIGFGFGACFVVYASLVASKYGTHRFGEIYPLIFLGYGAAGISGPSTGGWLYDLTNSYASSIGVSIAIIGVGLIVIGRLLRIADPQPR